MGFLAALAPFIAPALGVASAGGSIAASMMNRGSPSSSYGTYGPSQQPQFAPLTPRDRRLARDLVNMFAAAGGTTAAGVGQLGAVLPELYRQLGIDPNIQQRIEEIGRIQANADKTQSRIGNLERKINKLEKDKQTKKRNKQLRNLRSRLEGRRTELEEFRNSLTELQSESFALAPEEIPATSFLSPENAAREAVDLTLQQAVEALRGEVETDPTLLRQFDEQETVLRERLRRQLGPGYETSTAGIQALQAFERQKAEAIAGYTRDLASQRLSEGLGGETTLSDLISAGLQQGVFLPERVQAGGLSLAQTITPALGIADLLQRERAYVYPTAGYQTSTGYDPGLASQLPGMLQSAGTAGAMGQQLGSGLITFIGSRGATKTMPLAESGLNPPTGAYLR